MVYDVYVHYHRFLWGHGLVDDLPVVHLNNALVTA